ncbi:MAG TPA: glycosyltransferase family 4 protein [Polyangiales bacterium]|nr:glycosyltransferase family 4 protein [Polyangiales bacterium]
MKRFGFAIDNNVGNATVGKNLARFIQGRSDVQATFCPVELVAADVWQLVPGIRSNYALTASARAAAALYAIQRTGLDAAFLHSQSIGLFCMELMRRVPTLISSDATPANLDRIAAGYAHRVYSKNIERFKHAWTKATIRSAHTLLGFSSWVIESYVADYGVKPEKTVIIPPGVDTDLWRPDPSKRANDGVVRILFTGGELQRKGGDVLLRWARETRHSNFEIHMATRDRPQVPSRVRVHNDIKPNSARLVDLAQRCDLFALPTRADCFSIACLEANAAGLPAVITDIGGISEIVREGETGHLVPAGDETAFFERMDRLVADAALRERMGAAARERVVQHFNARRNAERVVGLMQSMG